MKKALLTFLICFCFCPAYSFDWKALHEKADGLTPASVPASAGEASGSTEDKYLLGLVYLNAHKDKEAREVFSSLLKGDPAAAAFKWGLAESLRRMHQVNDAEKILNEVLGQDPGFSPALISLAYIEYFKMDFTASVRLASKVIRQGRDNVDLSNYARAYAMYAGSKGMLAHYGGLFSKAIDGMAVKTNLEKARKLQADSPAVLFGLGSYYLLAPAVAGGDKAMAEEYLNKALQADPFFADVYVRLAQLFKIKGDKHKYVFYMNKALEIDPGNELAADTLSGRCKFICTGGSE